MGLETPRLDDRAFRDIVEEALERIPHMTQEWTAISPSDPGLTIIELFAWMTDIILYRLNRVPEKHFVKFMELLGMQLQEATPARAEVTFWLSAPQHDALEIPNGIEIATRRTESNPAIIFTTDGGKLVEVPDLAYLMTSTLNPEGRAFIDYDTNRMSEFKVFASESPQEGDALYLGFEKDLSKHILGIGLEVDVAEGAGIDPNNPPFAWEVQSTVTDELQWIELRRDSDTTLGLNMSGSVKLHLPQMKQSNHNGKLAYWIRLRLGQGGTENKYDVSPIIKRLTTVSWGATVSATNAARMKDEIVGRSDGTPGQTFFLDHTPVVTRTQSEYLVVIDPDGTETAWSEVTDFSQSGENDRHYTIDSNTGELRLGPALPQPDGGIRRYGSIPPKGTLLKMSAYRYGGGKAGNVAPGAISELKTALPYIDHVVNRLSASGGMDAETLENAKLRVPGYLRSLQRAVTAEDYELLTMQAEGARGYIGRTYCLQPPQTNRGEVQVLVIPSVPLSQGFISPESLELADDIRDEIIAYLDERRLLATKLDVTTPDYQWLETEVHFRLQRRAKAEVVTRAVEEKLYEFVNPLTGGPAGTGWPFGRDVLSSDISAALLTVDGVESVMSVVLHPVRYQNRQFTREDGTEEIPMPSQGVAVSYQHRAHAH
ncbi:putative baseplate assembly protein [Chloroflexota bacterium]